MKPKTAEQRGTFFSADRVYRYTLWREWGTGTLPILQPNHGANSYVMFIGLNPSTADETKDDPTIRKCIGFAKRWGFGSLCMTNLFAYRSTDPRKMKDHPNPIGDDNDLWLACCARSAGMIVAAWGRDGQHLKRDLAVMQILKDVHCLGLNNDGSPKHPLYVPYGTVVMQLQQPPKRGTPVW